MDYEVLLHRLLQYCWYHSNRMMMDVCFYSLYRDHCIIYHSLHPLTHRLLSSNTLQTCWKQVELAVVIGKEGNDLWSSLMYMWPSYKVVHVLRRQIMIILIQWNDLVNECIWPKSYYPTTSWQHQRNDATITINSSTHLLVHYPNMYREGHLWRASNGTCIWLYRYSRVGTTLLHHSLKHWWQDKRA